MINWSNLFWATILATYLVLVLAIWPLMVAAVKWNECQSTWRAAQTATWVRWNEIRTQRL